MTTIVDGAAGNRAGKPAARQGGRFNSLNAAGGVSRLEQEHLVMDKDRIAGAAKGIKGSLKELVGKAVGDAKLQSDGKAEQTAGKIQNAVGGVKDAVRDIVKT
jgi:uncharacterized protein YjbJ (UPF0337 family)